MSNENLIQIPDSVIQALEQRRTERAALQAKEQAEGDASQTRVTEEAARLGLSHTVETSEPRIEPGQMIPLTPDQVGPQAIRQAARAGTVESLGGDFYSIPAPEHKSE